MAQQYNSQERIILLRRENPKYIEFPFRILTNNINITMTTFNPPTRLLLGPGPSPVHWRVLSALARPTLGHLDPVFLSLMEEVKELLRYAFRTTNEMTLPISGPGSAGMEACFVNLVEPGDKVIVCRNGVFGTRMAEIVERCRGIPEIVDVQWGRAVPPELVEEAFQNHPDTKILAFVHAETSTGALTDAESLCAIARGHGALTIVDAVTSLGGVSLEVDAWGIDAVYSGTQKCLSCPPGLSPVSLNGRALEKVRARKTKAQSWFLDLSLIMDYWAGDQRVYHHTAPVNAIYGLHEALLMLKEEGIEESWSRHSRNHLALRSGLKDIGLEYLVPENEQLPSLNAVKIPADVDDASFRKAMHYRHDIEIGAGLGKLAGKIWRIGLMGEGSRSSVVERCLGCIDITMREIRGKATVAA